MFQLLLDWSEVWALLIPILVLVFSEKQPLFMKPVSIYLFLAFFLNVCADIISDYYRHFPVWLHNNTFIYNIHSIVRFIGFSYFFILVKPSFSTTLIKILSLVYLLYVGMNFILVESFLNPDHLSGNLLTAESYFLLICCLMYYLSKLIAETGELKSDKAFWVVTGLSLYVVTNFFIFLFYVPMITENPALAERMWNIHNAIYIVLSIFIAKAYHVPVRPKY